jgi:hypothetical protein
MCTIRSVETRHNYVLGENADAMVCRVQTPRVWLFGYDANHNPLKVTNMTADSHRM